MPLLAENAPLVAQIAMGNVSIPATIPTTAAPATSYVDRVYAATHYVVLTGTFVVTIPA